MNYKIAFIVAVAVGLSFSLGLIIGAYGTADLCIDTGFKLLEQQKIDIDVNQDLIKSAIFQYKNQIGSLG